jgi:hypothetical protein
MCFRIPVLVLLAFIAGIVFGLGSGLIRPTVTHAQASQKEIRAQTFVLTDEAGRKRGELGFERDGKSSLKLCDKEGKVVWSTRGPVMKPLMLEN